MAIEMRIVYFVQCLLLFYIVVSRGGSRTVFVGDKIWAKEKVWGAMIISDFFTS